MSIITSHKLTPQETIAVSLSQASEKTHQKVTQVITVQENQIQATKHLIDELKNTNSLLETELKTLESELATLTATQKTELDELTKEINKLGTDILASEARVKNLTPKYTEAKNENKTLRDQEAYWTSPAGKQARYAMAAARYQQAQAAANAARYANPNYTLSSGCTSCPENSNNR